MKYSHIFTFVYREISVENYVFVNLKRSSITCFRHLKSKLSKVFIAKKPNHDNRLNL